MVGAGATVQVLDPPDTEELHGPDGLLAQQLTRALDPALATGHQPVQVGAADQDSAGAHRDCGDHVRAVQDATVDVDLGAIPDGRGDRRQLFEGVGARSSWRPPWFEMTIASAPASTTAHASSTVWTPLMTIGPSHASRSQAKSAMVTVGSKTRLMRSATVPPVSEKTANRSGSVVSLSNHQPGWSAMSTSVRSESVGGIVNPLWTSRSRAPATGVSDGQDQRAEPRRACTANEVEAGLAIVPQVELEPAVRVGRRGGDVLGRRRPERRERVRDTHAARDAGDRRLALHGASDA